MGSLSEFPYGCLSHSLEPVGVTFVSILVTLEHTVKGPFRY